MPTITARRLVPGDSIGEAIVIAARHIDHRVRVESTAGVRIFDQDENVTIDDWPAETMVTVTEERTCNICHTRAAYDARTEFGPWAFLCDAHYEKIGTGIGVGIGQRIVIEPIEKSALSVDVPATDPEQTVQFATPRCVFCGKTSIVWFTPEEWSRITHPVKMKVERALPTRTKDFCTLVDSGLHSKCWDDMVGLPQ